MEQENVVHKHCTIQGPHYEHSHNNRFFHINLVDLYCVSYLYWLGAKNWTPQRMTLLMSSYLMIKKKKKSFHKITKTLLFMKLLRNQTCQKKSEQESLNTNDSYD